MAGNTWIVVQCQHFCTNLCPPGTLNCQRLQCNPRALDPCGYYAPANVTCSPEVNCSSLQQGPPGKQQTNSMKILVLPLVAGILLVGCCIVTFVCKRYRHHFWDYYNRGSREAKADKEVARKVGEARAKGNADLTDMYIEAKCSDSRSSHVFHQEGVIGNCKSLGCSNFTKELDELGDDQDQVVHTRMHRTNSQHIDKIPSTSPRSPRTTQNSRSSRRSTPTPFTPGVSPHCSPDVSPRNTRHSGSSEVSPHALPMMTHVSSAAMNTRHSRSSETSPRALPMMTHVSSSAMKAESSYAMKGPARAVRRSAQGQIAEYFESAEGLQWRKVTMEDGTRFVNGIPLDSEGNAAFFDETQITQVPVPEVKKRRKRASDHHQQSESDAPPSHQKNPDSAQQSGQPMVSNSLRFDWESGQLLDDEPKLYVSVAPPATPPAVDADVAAASLKKELRNTANSEYDEDKMEAGLSQGHKRSSKSSRRHSDPRSPRKSEKSRSSDPRSPRTSANSKS